MHYQRSSSKKREQIDGETELHISKYHMWMQSFYIEAGMEEMLRNEYLHFGMVGAKCFQDMQVG